MIPAGERSHNRSASHTCRPRQILGPALNGKNINGLEDRRIFLPSTERSGSNSSAVCVRLSREGRDRLLSAPETGSTTGGGR
jgi:hypothetical protein